QVQTVGAGRLGADQEVAAREELHGGAGDTGFAQILDAVGVCIIPYEVADGSGGSEGDGGLVVLEGGAGASVGVVARSAVVVGLVGRLHLREVGLGAARGHRGHDAQGDRLAGGQCAHRPDVGAVAVTALAGTGGDVTQPGGQHVLDRHPGGGADTRRSVV